MSASYEITLWCDECVLWETFPTRKVTTARKMARELGWTCTRHMGRYTDMCGPCNKLKASTTTEGS
jgi:hypothetical protein